MKNIMALLIAGAISLGGNAFAKDIIINDKGSVSIGDTLPKSLPGIYSRGLHIVNKAASQGKTVAGLRLEVAGKVDGGITSAYNADNSTGGLYVGTLSKHYLTLGTNSIGRLTITPDGHVGIGTYGALQPLHVQGNAYVYGKLGVGVASPANNLQVSGASALFSSDNGDFNVLISKKRESDNGSIVFQNNYTGRAQLGLVTDDNFHIQVSADGKKYNDALLINHNNGHIAVGSDNSASARFTIDDKDGGNALKAVSYNNGYSLIATKDGNGGAVLISKLDTGKGRSLHIVHNGSDPVMIIENSDAKLMVVDSNGNIGMGTAAPQGTLDVTGQIYQRGDQLYAKYVFEPDYRLESIKENAAFMRNNKHLKSMPQPATDAEGKEVIEIGSHYRGIVEELQKAHIYIEQLHSQMEEQNKRILLLEDRLSKN